MQDWLDGFRMLEGETLAGLLDDYAAVASQTDELLATLPDLDATQPLPEAPWYEPGRALVGAPCPAASDRGDLAARRARGHHQGSHRRRQDHGLTQLVSGLAVRPGEAGLRRAVASAGQEVRMAAGR